MVSVAECSVSDLCSCTLYVSPSPTALRLSISFNSEYSKSSTLDAVNVELQNEPLLVSLSRSGSFKCPLTGDVLVEPFRLMVVRLQNVDNLVNSLRTMIPFGVEDCRCTVTDTS